MRLAAIAATAFAAVLLQAAPAAAQAVDEPLKFSADEQRAIRAFYAGERAGMTQPMERGAGRPDDAGRPEAKGKADDKGKPDPKGKPDDRGRADARGGAQPMPPGLARKDELPPGLARQLAERGTLPPGLAKRSLPADLEARLPKRGGKTGRVIVDDDVVLIDTAADRILDVIGDVVRDGVDKATGKATGR
ncbi:MAG: hypothetical protein AB7N54_04835 [Alphaproteobacteria bacterium]